MNALITINSKNQDEELGVAFEAEMKSRLWVTYDEVPFVYFKTFEKDFSLEMIKKNIQTDINAAVGEAEWGVINYISIISSNHPIISKSEK